MSSDTISNGQSGALQIDVREEDDLDYWSERFGVSREKLRCTVERIGPFVRDIEDYFSGHR